MKSLILKVATLASILLFIGYILYSPKQAFAQNPNLIKRVEINLTQQKLYAFQNGQLIYSFYISSGTTIHPTITGTFFPYLKTLSTKMTGGSIQTGDFYDLPNVPFVVFFSGGYSIHGTYWHHNFGYPMSHGCINMRTDQARLIYSWIDYSTPISIYGVTPRS